MHAKGLSTSRPDMPNAMIDKAPRLAGAPDRADDPGLLDNA